jgi:hypothetical protein
MRWEYIGSSGTAAQNAVNLLYGPGSNGHVVHRDVDLSIRRLLQRAATLHGFTAGSFAPGAVFGPLGLNNNQVRGVGEIGFVFGDNIMKKP